MMRWRLEPRSCGDLTHQTIITLTINQSPSSNQYHYSHEIYLHISCESINSLCWPSIESICNKFNKWMWVCLMFTKQNSQVKAIWMKPSSFPPRPPSAASRLLDSFRFLLCQAGLLQQTPGFLLGLQTWIEIQGIQGRKPWSPTFCLGFFYENPMKRMRSARTATWETSRKE